jgi:hypothetical protein
VRRASGPMVRATRCTDGIGDDMRSRGGFPLSLTSLGLTATLVRRTVVTGGIRSEPGAHETDTLTVHTYGTRQEPDPTPTHRDRHAPMEAMKNHANTPVPTRQPQKVGLMIARFPAHVRSRISAVRRTFAGPFRTSR